MRFFKSVFAERSSEKEKPDLLTSEEYKKKGKEHVDFAWDVLHSTDNWRLEKQTADNVTVFSKHLPGIGKIFKLETEIKYPAKKLFEELVLKAEELPLWNPALKESRIIQQLDGNTRIQRQITTETAGGLVSSREFVDLVYMDRREGYYVSGGASIDYAPIPPHEKYIRAANGSNCWAMKSPSDASDHCTFRWLLNTKLNGWLPQYVVDAALTTAMLDYIKTIRTHCEKLREPGST